MAGNEGDVVGRVSVDEAGFWFSHCLNCLNFLQLECFRYYLNILK